MRSDIGCELSARGHGALRYAVVAILFAAAMAAAPVPASAADSSIHDFDPVEVKSPFKRIRGPAYAPIIYRQAPWWEANSLTPVDSGQYYEESPPDPGTGADNGTDCSRNVGRANPIYLSNANKGEFEVDFSDNDPELPLVFARTYNHNKNGGTPSRVTGNFWLTSLDYQFESGSGKFVARRPDGSSIYFSSQWTDGKYYENRAEPRRYVEIIQNKIVMHRGDGVVEHYDDVQTTENTAYSRIRKIENSRGVGWVFEYDSPYSYQPTAVIHTSGRRIRLEYADGRLVKVWDPAGNLYQYGGQSYQGSTYVIYPDGVTLTHHYTPRGEPYFYDVDELSGKSYDGVRYSTFLWRSKAPGDTSRRIPISSEHAGGVEKFQYEFTLNSSDDSVSRVVETNPLGKQATYAFEKGRLTSVTGHPSQLCAGSVSAITYDSNGFKDRVTDTRGYVTDYDYSAGGRLARVTEAAGTPQQRITESQWDPVKERLIETTVVGLHKISYRYDADDRIAETAVQNLSGNGVYGQVRSTHYSYTYHGNGKLATIATDGPVSGAGDAEVLTYSSTGNLLSARDGVGNVTTYSNHNGLGLPGRVELSTGAATEYSYDSRGRVLSERLITPRGTAEVKKQYAHGLLVMSTSTDGVETRYAYDAARRLTDEYVKEPDGTYARRHYVLNALSKPVSIEVSRVAAP